MDEHIVDASEGCVEFTINQRIVLKRGRREWKILRRRERTERSRMDACGRCGHRRKRFAD